MGRIGLVSPRSIHSAHRNYDCTLEVSPEDPVLLQGSQPNAAEHQFRRPFEEKEAAPRGPASNLPGRAIHGGRPTSSSHRRTSCYITGLPGLGAPLQIRPMPAIAATIWGKGPPPWPYPPPPKGFPPPWPCLPPTGGPNPTTAPYRGLATSKINTEPARLTLEGRVEYTQRIK